MAEEALKEIRINRKERRIGGIAPEIADACFTCGTCSGGCPITGFVPFEGGEGTWDPRKAIRAIVLGHGAGGDRFQMAFGSAPCAAAASTSAPWGSSCCKTFRACRTQRERDKVPGPIHKGTMMNLSAATTSGFPETTFSVLAGRHWAWRWKTKKKPCPGFYVPVDKEGANLIVTINSKEPFGEPDDMKFWWKIFYAAKEDWTVSSTNWEGVNWGLFSGDDPSWRSRWAGFIENARRLKCKTILYPE
jgi:hypothetical protein